MHYCLCLFSLLIQIDLLSGSFFFFDCNGLQHVRVFVKSEDRVVPQNYSQVISHTHTLAVAYLLQLSFSWTGSAWVTLGRRNARNKLRPQIWYCGEHLPYCGEEGWLHQCDLGLDSRSRRHVWLEFVIGSLLCSERFFFQVLRVFPLLKNQHFLIPIRPGILGFLMGKALFTFSSLNKLIWFDLTLKSLRRFRLGRNRSALHRSASVGFSQLINLSLEVELGGNPLTKREEGVGDTFKR